MKKQITYKNWILEVEKERTSAVYALAKGGSPEGCDCNECKNFLANKEKIYPTEFKDLLKKLGIEEEKALEVSHFGKLENGKHFYGGWFHFKGKILAGKDCKIAHENGSYTIETVAINENFEIGFTKNVDLSFFDESESKDLVQIAFFTKLDWVIDKKLESA